MDRHSGKQSVEAGPTPYNSIYSFMTPLELPPPLPNNKKKSGPCCLHGNTCPPEDEESGTYVNLMPKKISEAKIPEEEPSDLKQQMETSERQKKKLRRMTRELKALHLGEESPRHKKSRDKKEKHNQEPIDMENSESHTGISDSRKKKKARRDKKKETPFDTLDNLASVIREKMVKQFYLGVKTSKEAEAAVEKSSDFRLYHRHSGQNSLDELEPLLHLFIVYKAFSGSHKHYRVSTRQMAGKAKSYVVEHGLMKSEVHPSLEHMIRFYHTQFFSHQKKNGEQQLDAFPCWSDSN